MVWKHPPPQEHLTRCGGGGQARLPDTSDTAAGMATGNYSGKCVGDVVLESREGKSLCRKHGQSLTQTLMETNLYKPLNYLAWLIWLINS